MLTPKERLEVYKFLKTIYSLMNFDTSANGICSVLENSLNFNHISIKDLTELILFAKYDFDDGFLWDNDNERHEAILKAIDKIYLHHPAIETPNQLELFN
ncbi:MAG: hypothetical protein H7836_14045 [Magnetococcus sp. YQC-3]